MNSNTATGTVSYRVYTDENCTTLFANAGTKTVTNGQVPNSDPVIFNQAGTYFWKASYSGDGQHNAASSSCDDEVLTVTPFFHIQSVVSRKMHGTAGNFDANLPLIGEPGVECRTSGGNHTLIFTFNNNVLSGDASVISGIGSVTGSPFYSGNTMTVNLSGVADTQKITVLLSSVMDSATEVLPDTAVSVNILAGDTTGNKTVNSSDVAETKIQSGHTLTSANFREDVNTNGRLTPATFLK